MSRLRYWRDDTLLGLSHPKPHPITKAEPSGGYTSSPLDCGDPAEGDGSNRRLMALGSLQPSEESSCCRDGVTHCRPGQQPCQNSTRVLESPWDFPGTQAWWGGPLGPDRAPHLGPKQQLCGAARRKTSMQSRNESQQRGPVPTRGATWGPAGPGHGRPHWAARGPPGRHSAGCPCPRLQGKPPPRGWWHPR